MGEPHFTPDELETGRKLFAAEWRFITSAPNSGALPPMQGLEIAFAGRSNVGKSSLINALTGRHALARVSNTPGRTQAINFFSSSGPLVVADLPGYGFAKAPRAKVAAWTGLVRDYLLGRANLARTFVLVDSRHGLKDNDREVLDALDRAAQSYAIVLTKTDQLPAGAAPGETTAAAIANRGAAFPHVFATSSRTGAGLADLRAAIARLLAERRR